MKRSIQSLLFIAAALFSQQVTAQTDAGSYLKFELNGKPYSFGAEELGCYNVLDKDEEILPHTENRFYVDILNKSEYKMDLVINTTPGKKPVVGPLPFEASYLELSATAPSAHVSIDRHVGEDFTFYGAVKGNPGKFEITKVEGSWVEGTFELVMPNEFDEGDNLKVTNGKFRFKIQEQMD